MENLTGATVPAEHSAAKINQLPDAQSGGCHLANSVDWATFAKTAAKLFDRIDTNHDGVITDQELANAMENPNFHGYEAGVLAALFNASRTFEEKEHGKPLHHKVKGIDKSDLKSFEQLLKSRDCRYTAKPGQSLAYMDEPNEWAQLQLALTNKNKDERIALADIDSSIRLAKDDESRKCLQFLRDNFSLIQPNAKIATVGLTDLTDFATAYKRQAEPVWLVRDALYINRLMMQEPLSDKLYSDESHPANSITPEAIAQGRIGNCYFESTLASVAGAHKELIRDSIKDNKDGTYTVTFANLPNQHYTLKRPTEAQMSIFNRGGQFGLWASAIEKAYGLNRVQEASTQNRGNNNKPPEGAFLPQQASDGGGWSQWIIKLLTNKDCQTIDLATGKISGGDPFEALLDDFDFSLDLLPSLRLPPKINTSKPKTKLEPEDLHQEVMQTVRDHLIDDFSHNKAVTADRSFDKLLETKDVSLDARHSFSVLGFDANGPDGGTLTIRNPHKRPGPFESTFTMSLEKFLKEFSNLQEETDRPAA